MLPSQPGLTGRAGIPASPELNSTKSRRGRSRGGNPALPVLSQGFPAGLQPQAQILHKGRGGSCATELHREPGLQQSSCAWIPSCFPAGTQAEREIPWIPRMSFPSRHHEQNAPPQLEAAQAQLGQVLGGSFLAARGPSAALSNRKETWTPKPGAACPSTPLGKLAALRRAMKRAWICQQSPARAWGSQTRSLTGAFLATLLIPLPETPNFWMWAQDGASESQGRGTPCPQP